MTPNQFSIYDADCIISASTLSIFTLPIRTLNKNQRSDLSLILNAIHRADYSPSSYLQFIKDKGKHSIYRIQSPIPNFNILSHNERKNFSNFLENNIYIYFNFN